MGNKHSPILISKDRIRNIVNITEKNICKIKKNGGNETGFLCLIPFPDFEHLLPVLMTNYQILTTKEIFYGKTVKFRLFDKREFEIKIDYSREIYSNEKYDFSFFEIKPEDGLDTKNFLKMDSQAFIPTITSFLKKDIYLISFNKNKKKPEYSFGKLENINEKDYTFEFSHQKNNVYSGSPILNLNNQIIGIYKNANQSIENNIGYGVLVNNILEEINEEKRLIMETPIIESEPKIEEIINDEITIIYKKWFNQTFRSFNYFRSGELNTKIFGEKFVENNRDYAK